MAEPRKFYRLTSAGRSLWATRKTMPLPPEYRRILGLVDNAGHVEVISSQVGKYRREVVSDWLSEFEAAGLIESISGTEVALSKLARESDPPPVGPEDLPGFAQETTFADISLSRLGVYVGHDRIANRPTSVKSPAQTLALVVEDDPDQRVLAARRLKAAGYVVRTAECVEALYRALERHPPDAVFLDVNLPDGDGFSVLATLRLHPSFTYLPVILVTARTASADIKKGLTLGADGYVTKPYGANTLDYILRYVLKQELHSPRAVAA
jgi:CheY-like chemotaxis protein